MRNSSFVLTFLLTATAVLGASQASAQPDPRAQLDAAGGRLQEITEEYNEARLRRTQIEGDLARARGRVTDSEEKLDAARSRLGVAVRDLYMHRGQNLASIFEAKSYGQLQRGNALAGFATASIDTLILEVRRARAEESARAARLEGLRDDAKQQEDAIAARRRDAAAAFARTRALLADAAVQRSMEAERRADLATAGALAAARIKAAGPVRPGAAKAVATAAEQIGDPYQWGAAGPDRFDCSGLTMYAWASGGVSLPHSSRAQYSSLPHVSLDNLAPGDLIFSGSPIHHVAIYEGNGVVISAPHSGASVRRQSVWSLNPVGAARP